MPAVNAHGADRPAPDRQAPSQEYPLSSRFEFSRVGMMRQQRRQDRMHTMDLTLNEFGLPSDMLLWKVVLLTAISFGVGLLGGFVGLALGTMRLPAMLLLGMAAPIAGGTNILVSSLASLTGAIRHFREGRVNMRIVLFMGVPAFVGAFAGGFASDVVDERILVFLAGLLVGWQGVEFFIHGAQPAQLRRQPAPVRRGPGGLPGGVSAATEIAAEAGIGLGVGLLGGAVGLILGSIRLPALIRILKIDPRIAAGTNLFIGFFLGALGFVGHAVQGEVDYPLLAAMGAAAMIGSYIGAKYTGRASLNSLITTMGGVLLVVGVLLGVAGVPLAAR